MKQTPSLKKLIIQLKKAAQIYKQLMDKHYLIIYEGNYIEITFNKRNFKHLTGIGSNLNAKSFFDNSLSGKIRCNQIFFDMNHPYALCKKKLEGLINLEKSLCSDLLILHKIKSKTYIIPEGLTNLDFVLGLDVNNNKNGKILNEMLIPYTLRVEDDTAFDNSSSQHQVDFIISKLAQEKMYSTLYFGNASNLMSLPEEIKSTIDFNNIEIYNIII